MTLEQVIADCKEEISDCQIDLDGISELLEKHPERKEAFAHDIDDYKKRMDYNRQLAEWLRELRERRKAPEIITGEWELKDHQWECAKCGCRINVKNPLDCDKWNYYYCPHCGTKMLIAVQRGR